MVIPSDPPPDLALPSGFLDPSPIPSKPDVTSPAPRNSDVGPSVDPAASGSDRGSPTDTAGGDVIFGARAVDQEFLEREIAVRADQLLLEKANEDDQRRLDKTATEKAKLEYMLAVAQERHNRPAVVASEKKTLLEQINELKEQITRFNDDIDAITLRMLQRGEESKALSNPAAVGSRKLPHESDREFLIRTGKITPFDQIPVLGQASSGQGTGAAITASNLRQPGFSDVMASLSENSSTESAEDDDISHNRSERRKAREAEDRNDDISRNRPRKHRSLETETETEDDGDIPHRSKRKRTRKFSDEEYVPRPKGKAPRRKIVRKAAAASSSASDFHSLDSESDGVYDSDYNVDGDVATKRRKLKSAPKTAEGKGERLDDGDERLYQKRLREWTKNRRKTRKQHNLDVDDEDGVTEWLKPHPTIPDMTLPGGVSGFKLPGDIHESLMDYQKVAVQWLWELHCQNAGGILGDEMGLGKTIQMISLIAGLHHSGLLDKPCIVVAPGAVLSQWASEFHKWWPVLRVAILHKSGSGMLVAKEDDVSEYSQDDSAIGSGKGTSKPAAKKIVDRVFNHGHILITTYEGLTTYGDILLEKEWSYAILDEGHKIRNPDARVSLTCKQLKTHHRVILSGTPIQNNLIELWSLFDFVFPGRLGTLPVFKEQFEVPIRLGGYKNAENTSVETATSCARVLRELIGPYLLRRAKLDVAKDLPAKHEQVLLCQLTPDQTTCYQDYLKSKEVADVRNGKRDQFSAIDVLRKICCHPDLLNRKVLENKPGYEYGKDSLSGKMVVMKGLLQQWKEEGHRVLLFSQTVQVLNILEKSIRGYGGFKFLRMDGSTPITKRQPLVDQFNHNSDIDVFLLTTRVGGLGLNLTGADRVIIFDPDWNPSTDLQARERAWRIGQSKPVSIFRLVTAGTIEEKMYHRQIFKQHMAQKILNNPESRRYFDPETLHDLFSFDPTGKKSGTSTGAMFKGAETIYGKGPTESASKSNPEDKEDSDLRKIKGVAGLTEYTAEDGKSGKEAGERKFIEAIFADAGVVSSIEHEKLVGAGDATQGQSGPNLYSRQVAQAAEKALRESIKAAQAAPIGTLTWTGRSGEAGKEPPRRTSAAGLLGKLSERAGIAKKIGNPACAAPLRRQMLVFFSVNRGTVTTAKVKEWCKTVGIDQRDLERAEKMKATLKEIAVLDRATHTWRLRG